MVDVKLSMCKWETNAEKSQNGETAWKRQTEFSECKHSHALAGYSNGHNSSERNTSSLAHLNLFGCAKGFRSMPANSPFTPGHLLLRLTISWGGSAGNRTLTCPAACIFI